MLTFQLFSLSLLLAFPPTVATQVEKAFLQNSPAVLREALTTEGTIPVSLPEPLSLADHLSPDQAFLVFKRIFAVFKTTEFTTEPGLSALPGSAGGILKARWSFRNERTGGYVPLRVHFFVVPVRLPPASGGRGPRLAFKIVEIRAEKL